MNLSNIILTTKVARVAFPGIPGFVVSLAAVSRETSRKIREESEITTIDPKAKIPIKELNEEIFLEKFTSAAIKGWTGLKYKDLANLVLVDLTEVENVEDEVEYSPDNALQLIKHSQAFDNWVNDEVFSLETFRDPKKV